MKIFGIIIIVVSVIVNILIGLFILGMSWNQANPSTGTNSASGSKVTISDETIPYINNTHKFQFNYPKDWPITTTIANRENDPTLIDSFNSLNESDKFLEGFTIYSNKSVFSQLEMVDYMRNNLVANGYKILSEKPGEIAGRKWHRFDTTSTIKPEDGTAPYDIRGYVYSAEGNDEYITVEYYDQISTFENTKGAFIKTMESFKFI